MIDIESYIKTRADAVNAALPRFIKGLKHADPRLAEAMAYSLSAGGKRLRPLLMGASYEIFGGKAGDILPAACALEMVHTYSLVHDDLPAMDDDDLRRGKPTNHKVFGEAAAILAGDGLLTLAFETAADNAAALRLPGRDAAELVRVIAAGAGWRGMVGGQMADLESEKTKASELLNGRRAAAKKRLEYVHTHKTAALIIASLEAGAVMARASEARRRALREYGKHVGLAFQIADDVLDRVGDKAKLGKKGSDLANDKLTYPRLFGLERSRELARQHVALAHAALKPFGPRAAVLHELADYVVSRDR